MLSNIEIGCFVNLFNRSGYVLNFTTADFDAFTLQHVGIPLCSRYGLSKGKSLLAFTEDAANEDVAKLLFVSQGDGSLDSPPIHFWNTGNGSTF